MENHKLTAVFDLPDWMPPAQIKKAFTDDFLLLLILSADPLTSQKLATHLKERTKKKRMHLKMTEYPLYLPLFAQPNQLAVC